MYSPMQVFGGTLLGGPLAAVYFLWKNYRSLSNKSAAQETLIKGSCMIALLFLLVPFFPEGIPRVSPALPMLFAVAASSIASKDQMSKDAIALSEQHTFQSNWRVVCIGIAFFVAALGL